MSSSSPSPSSSQGSPKRDDGDLQSKVIDLQSKVEKLCKLVDEQGRKIKQQEDKIKQQGDKIKQQEDKIKQQEERIGSLEMEVVSLKDDKRNLQAQVDNLQEQVDLNHNLLTLSTRSFGGKMKEAKELKETYNNLRNAAVERELLTLMQVGLVEKGFKLCPQLQDKRPTDFRKIPVRGQSLIQVDGRREPMLKKIRKQW
jgi:predicted RNase H-like nuclease (RuvC/YqgF family)